MSKKTSGIYKITNDRTGETYIGQSKNIEKRWEQHKEELSHGIHHNKGMQYDYHYGDTFSYEILEKTEPNKQTLNQKEEQYISKYDTYNHGYNQTRGGKYDKNWQYDSYGGGRKSNASKQRIYNYSAHKNTGSRHSSGSTSRGRYSSGSNTYTTTQNLNNKDKLPNICGVCACFAPIILLDEYIILSLSSIGDRIIYIIIIVAIINIILFVYFYKVFDS